MESLAKRYAHEREQVMMPVSLGKGKQIELSPGAHSELVKAIPEAFVPCFAAWQHFGLYG